MNHNHIYTVVCNILLKPIEIIFIFLIDNTMGFSLIMKAWLVRFDRY